MDRSPTSATYLIPAHEIRLSLGAPRVRRYLSSPRARVHCQNPRTRIAGASQLLPKGPRGACPSRTTHGALGSPGADHSRGAPLGFPQLPVPAKVSSKTPFITLQGRFVSLFLETNYPSGLFLCSEGLPGLLAGTTTTRLLRALRRRQAPPQKTRSRACADGPRSGSPKPRSPPQGDLGSLPGSGGGGGSMGARALKLEDARIFSAFPVLWKACPLGLMLA